MNGPWRSAVFAFILVLSFLIFPTQSAVADTKFYTLTEDFDAGFKSNSSGNYAVETYSDNRRNDLNELILANRLSDTFPFCDSDANTFKWVASTTDLDSDTSSTVRVCNNDLFRNSGLWMSIVARAAGQGDINILSSVGLRSAKDAGGTEIDSRIQVSNPFPSPQAGSSTSTLFYEIRDANDDFVFPIPVDDQALWTGTCTNACSSYSWQASRRLDGGLTTNVGSAVSLNNALLFLRITLATSGVVTWFYSTDGATWVQQAQQADLGATWFGADSVVTLSSIRLAQNTNAATTLFPVWGEFQWASGTFDVSTQAFQTSGFWETQPISHDLGVPRSITLTYSGASAAGFIDQIAFLDVADIVVWSSDTDITSGTSTTISTGSPSGNYKLRITFGGDGSASVSIEDISLVIEPELPVILPKMLDEVRLSCEYRWPQHRIECLAVEGFQRDLVVKRTWFVNGEARQSVDFDPENGTRFSFSPDFFFLLPWKESFGVSYRAELFIPNVAFSAFTRASADTSWLLVLYLIFGTLAAIGRVERSRGPRKQEAPS